jgi:hypothetical protein
MTGTTRQAVLIIHGIGDQKPMETMRGFVKAVWPTSPTRRTWSRPDTLSENFDLRQIVTRDEKTGQRTDFFELYWAHLMEGTKLAGVWAWIWYDLLLRPGRTMPKVIRSAKGFVVAYLVLVLIAAALAVAAPLFGWRQPWLLVTLEWLLIVSFIAINVLFLRDIVGDAARYFRLSPENIRARRNIIKLGVEVLDKLHEPERRYDRIILVGHSLGTVVGYDVLTYAFAQRSRAIAASAGVNPPELPAWEQAAQAVSEIEEHTPPEERQRLLAAFQAAQRALNRAFASETGWRVTDFVTLGSPLTYADVLLCKGGEDLQVRIGDRELPVCPPRRDKGPNARGMRAGYYEGEKGLHIQHAAVFAFTRWTNLFFPVRRVIFGDIVGGPIAPLLGRGVKDVRVHCRHLRERGLLSHTSYWTDLGFHGDPNHVDALRMALDLDDRATASTLPSSTDEEGPVRKAA